jgi:hypothetical protein
MQERYIISLSLARADYFFFCKSDSVEYFLSPSKMRIGNSMENYQILLDLKTLSFPCIWVSQVSVSPEFVDLRLMCLKIVCADNAHRARHYWIVTIQSSKPHNHRILYYTASLLNLQKDFVLKQGFIQAD